MSGFEDNPFGEPMVDNPFAVRRIFFFGFVYIWLVNDFYVCSGNDEMMTQGFLIGKIDIHFNILWLFLISYISRWFIAVMKCKVMTQSFFFSIFFFDA